VVIKHKAGVFTLEKEKKQAVPLAFKFSESFD
jgi:hypothetical protein